MGRYDSAGGSSTRATGEEFPERCFGMFFYHAQAFWYMTCT